MVTRKRNYLLGFHFLDWRLSLGVYQTSSNCVHCKTMRILASTVSLAWFSCRLKNGIQASFLSSQDGLVKDDTPRALVGGG